MKKNLLVVMITAIIFTMIGVGAATMFKASDIEFIPKDENWKVNNLSDALDDLYEKADKRKFIIKDGVLQEGYSIVARDGEAVYSVENGLMIQKKSSNWNLFISNVDMTGYNKWCVVGTQDSALWRQIDYGTTGASGTIFGNLIDISSYNGLHTIDVYTQEGKGIKDVWLE